MEIKEIDYTIDKTHLSFYRESNTSFARNDCGESVSDYKSYTTRDIANMVKKRLDAMVDNPDSRGVNIEIILEQYLEVPQTCTEQDISLQEDVWSKRNSL